MQMCSAVLVRAEKYNSITLVFKFYLVLHIVFVVCVNV